MNNNNKSKLNVDLSTSKLDDKTNDSESESELNEPNSCNVKQQIDTSELKLIPRMWYFMKFSARKTYSVCCTAGDKIAWFFGITKPKYHAEIQHYERMNAEDQKAWREAFQDIEHTNHILDSIR
ncbi:unnamed protein product [Adineta steineri]|uniref:Uncharacterized protein n=1 Tax=Adineta steineri TaxID=433720 RepID=A0A819G017_9BILA|nr:unnamed protein product [Adineta steineri]CAF3877957.1 unnamed protein product [Adineta steineri]